MLSLLHLCLQLITNRLSRIHLKCLGLYIQQSLHSEPNYVSLLTQPIEKRDPKFIIFHLGRAPEFVLGAVWSSEFDIEFGGDVVPVGQCVPWQEYYVALDLDVDEEVHHPFHLLGGEDSAVGAVVTV